MPCALFPNFVLHKDDPHTPSKSGSAQLSSRSPTLQKDDLKKTNFKKMIATQKKKNWRCVWEGKFSCLVLFFSSCLYSSCGLQYAFDLDAYLDLDFYLSAIYIIRILLLVSLISSCCRLLTPSTLSSTSCLAPITTDFSIANKQQHQGYISWFLSHCCFPG